MSRVPSVGRAVTQKKPQNDSGPAARDLSSRRSANPKHDKLTAPVILKPPTEEPEEEQEDEESASDGSDGEGVEKVPQGSEDAKDAPTVAESVPPMAPQEEDEPRSKKSPAVMMKPYPDYKSMSDSQRDEYLDAEKNKKYRESLNKKGQTTKPAQPREVRMAFPQHAAGRVSWNADDKTHETVRMDVSKPNWGIWILSRLGFPAYRDEC